MYVLFTLNVNLVRISHEPQHGFPLEAKAYLRTGLVIRNIQVRIEESSN